MKITPPESGSAPALGASGIGGSTSLPAARDITVDGGYYGAGDVEEALSAIAAELARLAGTGATRHWPSTLALTSEPRVSTLFDATAPTTSAVGDAAAAGVSPTVAARRDHRHGRESFAAPTIALGAAGAAGVATTPIRSDATIAAFDATVPVTQAFGDAAAVGAAAFAARRDHRHGMMATPSQVSRDATAAAADYVARIRLGTDTTYRAFLGLDASDRAALEFGPGGAAARDTSLARTGLSTLRLGHNGTGQAPILVIEGASAGDEGGELQLAGSGANASWAFDNYQGRVRWHSGGLSYMDLGTTRWSMSRLMAIGSTAFPASPTTNDVFYRTDRRMFYAWDGTRWLCTCPHRVSFPIMDALAPFSGNAALNVGRLAGDVEYTMFLEAVVYAAYVLTPNNASNFHNLDLLDAGSVAIAGAAANTSANAADVWVAQRKAINLVSTTAKFHLRLNAKTGTPGTMYLTGVLHYRLVG